MGKRGRPRRESPVLLSRNNVKIVSYFQFMGKADEFRVLDQQIKNAYISKALKLQPKIKCLSCSRELGHRYGALYHIDRCGIDDAHKPWSCYKCGYKSLNSESEMHLKRCQGPGLPLLDITSDGHVMREIKRVNQEKDKKGVTTLAIKGKRKNPMMEYRDIRGLCGGKKEYDSYREKVDEALKQVNEVKGDLCGQLKDIQPVKFQNEHKRQEQ
ncbi:hypothetical protein WR25_13392 [Diploscapter pachys]|uniref:Uncharacterized protein n=1 Tax=Diploscapter pachys TaxID=2018661 RepID=A0A2A2J2X9_9BILA|nr:hypothetical protein WR25_13392 [Diploscapter pachys]